MDRERVKKMLPIFQAFAEGKTIEYDNQRKWVPIRELDIVGIINPELYRIKPQPEYRPFKSAEECWDEMLCHSPFGWIKNERGVSSVITFVSNNYHTTAFVDGEERTFEELANHWCFVDDGMPFGMKEED